MATSERKTPGLGKRGKAAQEHFAEASKADVPVFPYSPRLREDEKEIWLETVNSKTGDYWRKSDTPILEMYCRLTADVRRLTEEIRHEGEVIHNANGNLVVNPKIVVRGYSEARLMTLCTKLRMQPSARMDSEGEKHQLKKKDRAVRAAGVVDADEDDLLAGSETLQ